MKNQISNCWQQKVSIKLFSVVIRVGVRFWFFRCFQYFSKEINGGSDNSSLRQNNHDECGSCHFANFLRLLEATFTIATKAKKHASKKNRLISI